MRHRKEKRKIGRYIFFTVVATVGILIVAVFAISFSRAESLMHLEPTPLDPYVENMLGSKKNIKFTSNKGQITLYGWWIPASQGEPIATIVLVHDRDNNRLQFGQETVKFINFLTHSGFNVLSFDQRSCGQSGEGLHAYGYNAATDLEAALNYAKAAGETKLIVYGFGSGNSLIWHCWHNLLESPDQDKEEKNSSVTRQDIAGIIMDSPIRSTETCIKVQPEFQEYRFNFIFSQTIPYAIRLSAGNATDIDFLELMLKAPCPIFITRNKPDNFYPKDGTDEIFSELLRLRPSLTTAYETEVEGHISGWITKREDYEKSLKDFFNNWFKK